MLKNRKWKDKNIILKNKCVYKNELFCFDIYILLLTHTFGKVHVCNNKEVKLMRSVFTHVCMSEKWKRIAIIYEKCFHTGINDIDYTCAETLLIKIKY